MPRLLRLPQPGRGFGWPAEGRKRKHGRFPERVGQFHRLQPYCYPADPQLDQCSINFRFVRATDDQSTAPYIALLAVAISGKKRLSIVAFFEASITYSYDMAPGK